MKVRLGYALWFPGSCFKVVGVKTRLMVCGVEGRLDEKGRRAGGGAKRGGVMGWLLEDGYRYPFEIPGARLEVFGERRDGCE
jgi:hypothetical protein